MEGWEPDAVAIIEWVFETTLRIIVYAFGSLPLKRHGIELSVPDKDYVIGGIRNFKFRPFRMGFFCFIMLYIIKMGGTASHFAPLCRQSDYFYANF